MRLDATRGRNGFRTFRALAGTISPGFRQRLRFLRAATAGRLSKYYYIREGDLTINSLSRDIGEIIATRRDIKNERRFVRDRTVRPCTST